MGGESPLPHNPKGGESIVIKEYVRSLHYHLGEAERLTRAIQAEPGVRRWKDWMKSVEYILHAVRQKLSNVTVMVPGGKDEEKGT